MSELKAFDCVESDLQEFCEPRLVYLKSEVDKRIAELKYKRCVALAQGWRSYASFCGMNASSFNKHGFGKTAEKFVRKENHAWKCYHRWLDIAKTFREGQ